MKCILLLTAHGLFFTGLFFIIAGNFFVEMGWYCGADKIFNCVLMLCKALTPVPYKIVLLCHVRLVDSV